MTSPLYDVRISARAERDLFRLPEKIAAACMTFIFGPLAEQPYRLGGELRGQLAGLRSARRGSYRIVYNVDDAANRIDIIHIDHRRNVYRLGPTELSRTAIKVSYPGSRPRLGTGIKTPDHNQRITTANIYRF